MIDNKISQDDRGCLAINMLTNFALRIACGAQRFFGLTRCQPLILKIDGNFEREFKITSELACLSSGLTFRAIKIERQTNPYPSRVKALKQFGHRAQQFFPIRSSQR